jgi:cobalt-zinc-cadmium efflux system protein
MNLGDDEDEFLKSMATPTLRDPYAVVRANDLPEADLVMGTYGGRSLGPIGDGDEHDAGHGGHEGDGHHGHHHGHGHHRHASPRTLWIVLAMTVSLIVFEVLVGLGAGSISLLSDAVHVLCDAAAVGISLAVAVLSAARSGPRALRFSYGMERLDVLGGLVTSLFVCFLGANLILSALRRIVLGGGEVNGAAMVMCALASVAVNVASLWLLRDQHGSQSVKGLYIHIAGDLAAAIGVLVAGLTIQASSGAAPPTTAVRLSSSKGRGGQAAAAPAAAPTAPSHVTLIDPVLSIVVSAAVLYSSAKLVYKCGMILMQSSPRALALPHVAEILRSVPGVVSCHDLHTWSIDADRAALSAHVVVSSDRLWEEILGNAHTAIKAEFPSVKHCDLQLENPSKRSNLLCAEATAEV